ncbi:MAG: ubiquinone biosynthesis protein [Cyanobacteria bacterium SBLK]|nr:ubiquinone biosynthesis protein [Cyanobacteria bacterium SBLK]
MTWTHYPDTESITQTYILQELMQNLNNDWQMMRVGKSFLAMLWGDESLATVGEMEDALLQTPSFDLAAKFLRQDPDSAALIEERYLPSAHDLQALLAYPKDSLGYIYAKNVTAQGFNPNLHYGMAMDSDASYVAVRLNQTHDIWHAITGFDASSMGEIALQAFHLGQFPYPLATMLVANSLVSLTLFEPESLSPWLEAIARGWEMGRQAKSLFAQKWEENWERSLLQWQTELNIRPV